VVLLLLNENPISPHLTVRSVL